MADAGSNIDWPDHLGADRWSALGDQPVLLVDAASHAPPPVAVQALIIGCDRDGALPSVDAAAFDLLLTTAANPPAPWVEARDFEALANTVRQWPVAATMLVQVMRMTETMRFDDALVLESLAYSSLLGGGEFRRWREATTSAPPADGATELVQVTRADDHITITLSDPDRQNAMTGTMRDVLYAALANALDDPTVPVVSLRGAGKCFSTGGHIPEFGVAADLAQAHLIRTLHSCARLIAALGDRIDVHFHGACVGSGLEVPAAASRRTASPDTWFQLPELRMGLIPGAGGTVSVARAIGRHRTAWMVLSGKRLSARQALDWGLIHAITDRP
jgi:enoyl-CoA hydratase/carnithine racemase